MSSLKDAPPLMPELEAAIRATINPMRVKTIGTESHERAAMLGEIDRLRAEVAELAQQRGGLLRRVVELEQDAARLDHIEKSARCDPKMDGQHVWWPTSFNHRLIGPTLRDAIDSARGRSGASESQPSEQTR